VKITPDDELLPAPQDLDIDDSAPARAERYSEPWVLERRLARWPFTKRGRSTSSPQRRTRHLVDLTVLVLALATPTLLVLVGQVGVAVLLAAAEFGAVIMHAWWSRPDGE
jgi:hypothetical protein